MIAKILSAIPLGFSGALVEVEGDKNQGLPSFNIVGMASRTVSESKERVRSALANSDFSFPSDKLTINLAPADLNKDGTHLDLPIALSVLLLSDQLQENDVKDRLFVGELSLEGTLRPIRGIINIVETAKNHGLKEVYLPYDNLPQASLISGIRLVGVKTLRELFLYLKHQIDLPDSPTVKSPPEEANQDYLLDYIKGQSAAKRALTVAIAGHHNLLISGPPGAGKTLLAKTALNLLPPLSDSEQIPLTKLYSLASNHTQIITNRPFRSPHHTASLAAVVGGGGGPDITLPGEISLAHLGVLFLDELPEYPRHILESLRQPLEDHEITISRAHRKTTYPANFMLIATMNPCPCGYYGDPDHACTCTAGQVLAYQKKLSGPLLDRIDLHISVQKVPTETLFDPTSISNHPSEHNVVKNTITDAIQRQYSRYHSDSLYNSSLSSYQVTTKLRIKPDAKQLLETASDRFNLSARSFYKVLKVAQTIADLEGSAEIATDHISESLSYRLPDFPSI